MREPEAEAALAALRAHPLGPDAAIVGRVAGGAARIGAYEVAIANVFGSNAIMVALLYGATLAGLWALPGWMIVPGVGRNRTCSHRSRREPFPRRPRWDPRTPSH